MARKRNWEPLAWALFSGGGMASALFLPALVLVLWIAVPLGFLGPAEYESMRLLVGRPVVRVVLGILLPLCFVHGAHRFRHTLYDGLQLHHLSRIIAVGAYGFALLLSAGTLWMLLTLD